MSKLKRLAAPKFWKQERKGFKLTVSPRPGAHKKKECLPLQIVVRDILKLVETGTEAKSIIRKGEVIVDGLVRKDPRYPAGLMDVISIPKINKFYRIISTKKGLEIIEVDKSDEKLCRINGKTTVKEGKIQLNLHDGRCVLVDKTGFKTGDSVLLEMPSQKIKEHLKMEKGCLGLVIKGKNSGNLVTVKDLIIPRGREPNKLICEMDKKDVEVLKDYVLVVGKDKPVIKVG